MADPKEQSPAQGTEAYANKDGAEGNPPGDGVTNQQPPPTTPLFYLREEPAYVFCPQKGAYYETNSESKDSDKTWFAVLGICFICPCAACIPLKGCGAMLQDWGHYCSGCGQQLTHRPYNKENQILRPDHDSANPNNPVGWQNGPPQMHYQNQSQQPQQQQPQ